MSWTLDYDLDTGVPGTLGQFPEDHQLLDLGRVGDVTLDAEEALRWR